MMAIEPGAGSHNQRLIIQNYRIPEPMNNIP